MRMLVAWPHRAAHPLGDRRLEQLEDLFGCLHPVHAGVEVGAEAQWKVGLGTRRKTRAEWKFMSASSSRRPTATATRATETVASNSRISDDKKVSLRVASVVVR